jgi:hypothetical protein
LKEFIMPRFRITITDAADRAEQLRRAARVRHDLIEQAKVRVDSTYPLIGIHRDEQERAYLEMATDDLDQVREVLRQFGHDPYVQMTEPREPLGEACANCGNIAGPVLPAICPNCGFHDIARCPICGELNPRSNYEKLSGNLFRCPVARDGVRHRVRFAYNEPVFEADGTYRQPLVLVQEAVPE